MELKHTIYQHTIPICSFSPKQLSSLSVINSLSVGRVRRQPVLKEDLGEYIYRKEFVHDGPNLQGILSSGFLANNNLSTLIKLVSNHLICRVFYFSKTSN